MQHALAAIQMLLPLFAEDAKKLVIVAKHVQPKIGIKMATRIAVAQNKEKFNVPIISIELLHNLLNKMHRFYGDQKKEMLEMHHKFGSTNCPGSSMYNLRHHLSCFRPVYLGKKHV
jgi:hypothetical protein